MANRLGRLGLKALYFSRFLLTTVPAHLLLMLLFLRRPRAPVRVYGYLALVAIYVLTVLLLNPTEIPLRNILFYFSFLPAFLVMLSSRDRDTTFAVTDGFIVVLCVLTLADALIINTPLGANIWFFPADHPYRNLMFGGLYQRPIGVAGVASSSAAVIVISLVLSDVFKPTWALFSKKNIFAVLALIVLISGTGFVLFVLYLMLKTRSRSVGPRGTRWVSKMSLLVIIAMLVLASSVSLSNGGFEHFSFEYAMRILDNKVLTSFGFESRGLLELSFGGQVNRMNPVFSTSSDFGYAGMFQAIGAVGSMLVLGAPLLFMRSLRFYKVPTLFFFLSFAHYPALSSPPGAVLFALYLNVLRSHRRNASFSMARRRASNPAAAGPLRQGRADVAAVSKAG